MVNVGGCLRTCLPCSICFCSLLLYAKEKGEAGGSHGASNEAKVVGLICRSAARAATLSEGVSARAVVEHRAKRAREIGDGRVMPMTRCMIN
jgi:hypothetical protein